MKIKKLNEWVKSPNDVHSKADMGLHNSFYELKDLEGKIQGIKKGAELLKTNFDSSYIYDYAPIDKETDEYLPDEEYVSQMWDILGEVQEALENAQAKASDLRDTVKRDAEDSDKVDILYSTRDTVVLLDEFLRAMSNILASRY